MFKFVLLLLIMTSLLAATESAPVTLTRVVDAVTLEAVAKLGGQAVYINIGIAGIAAPSAKEASEAEEISRNALFEVLDTGRQSRKLFPVLLEIIGDRFVRDDRSRILAIISFIRPRATLVLSTEEPSATAPPVSRVQQGESLQEYMVRNGWAALKTDANLPAPLKERLVALQKTASNANIGLWKDYRTAMELASQKRPLP